MKNTILAFLLLLSFQCFSQTNTQPLVFKNGFFGWQFKRGEQKLTMGEVSDLLKTNTEASTLFSKAKSANIIATVVGAIGGGMLGYTLGTSAGGGNANWTVGGIGAGLIVAAIPISLSANSKITKAVTLYNEGLRTGLIPRQQWQVIFKGSQLGLVCNF